VNLWYCVLNFFNILVEKTLCQENVIKFKQKDNVKNCNKNLMVSQYFGICGAIFKRAMLF